MFKVHVQQLQHVHVDVTYLEGLEIVTEPFIYSGTNEPLYNKDPGC